MAKGFELKVADVSGLTDADWTAINKVMVRVRSGALRSSGMRSTSLATRPQIKVAGAFFPEFNPRGAQGRNGRARNNARGFERTS